MAIITIINIGAYNFCRRHIVTDIVVAKIKAQGHAPSASSLNTGATFNIHSMITTPGHSNTVTALAFGCNLTLKVQYVVLGTIQTNTNGIITICQ